MEFNDKQLERMLRLAAAMESYDSEDYDDDVDLDDYIQGAAYDIKTLVKEVRRLRENLK